MADSALITAVKRAQEGDARAFDTLVRQFQNPAVAYARTLLRDPAAAEDAAQEAFVQAWRDLPRLAEAASFGAWLRRIVFKFCDRVRRSTHLTLALDDTLPLHADQEPSAVVERMDDAAQVRAAIDLLPCALREATLLYYLTGHDIKEIAAFLELPSSTVKNRLHAARKILRKELWIMAEMILEKEKPSQSEKFTESVLARVLREFQRQKAADPRNVDRGLLDQGRTEVFKILGGSTQLDCQTLRDGFLLLRHKQDWQALATLLMRYLKQPLSDSETAWAYLHLVDSIARSGSAAGAALAQDAFDRWRPGKSPVLSATWPFYPASDDMRDSAYVGDEVRYLFLSQSPPLTRSYVKELSNSDFPDDMTAFLQTWCNGEYLARVDSVLSDVPDSERNRSHRFAVLRKAANNCVSIGDLDSTERYIQQMRSVAENCEDETLKTELKAKALGQAIHLAGRKRDDATWQACAMEMIALLDNAALGQRSDACWLRNERQALAIVLMRGNRHDLALPLWEANAAAGGQVNGWGWLLHAATNWQLTRDRRQTLALLRHTRAYDDDDIIALFTARAEFAEAREDAEFLEAIGGRASGASASAA